MLKLNLNNVLKDREISLFKLSKDINVTYSVLHRYQKGGLQRVDLSVLDKICTSLNCQINDLLEFENDNKKSTATA